MMTPERIAELRKLCAAADIPARVPLPGEREPTGEYRAWLEYDAMDREYATALREALDEVESLQIALRRWDRP